MKLQFCTPCCTHHPYSGRSSFLQYQGRRPLQQGTLLVLSWCCIGNATFTSACMAAGIFEPTSGFACRFHVKVFDDVYGTASPPDHLSYPSSAIVTCNTHGSVHAVLAQHDLFRCWKEIKACKADAVSATDVFVSSR